MKQFILLIISLCLVAVTAAAAERIVILALFKDRAMLEINGNHITLSAGESTGNGITLISANSEAAVIEVDGVSRSYGLGSRISTGFRPPSPGQIVTIAPDRHGMFWVNGSINKFQTRFMVDTGATFITMNSQDANRFGLDYKTTGEPALSTTASGEETVYLVNLQSVSVGDIRLSNVTAAVHDSDFPRTILLGNSFLNQVSLKREGQILQLSK